MFSGRRGIHCWTCDKTARHLSLKNRNAVAEYLNLFSSNSRITIGDRMHHSVKRAYRIVESYFDEILAEQNFFGTIERRKKLLDLVNDENVRKELESRVLAFAEDDSKGVWNLVKQTLNNIRGPKANRMKYNVEEIQLTYLYPRLDIAVSKATNHLLKAPFCVHPKTGKICVPFNPNAVSKFDPTTVPTMRKLLKSIDSFDNKNVNDEDAGNQSRIKVDFVAPNKQSIVLSYFFFCFISIAGIQKDRNEEGSFHIRGISAKVGIEFQKFIETSS